ncbi:hypothetical protein GCM10008938_00390 [Deinococcus roseus]|uniref:ABC transporter permease n=1 Tax=Deinococcus roseus TaxID=392414 RepID=A0ABQ2CT13_9DEIO|nr:hypothetical protein GCM10008938_00390 [Deinococcus roseus]
MTHETPAAMLSKRGAALHPRVVLSMMLRAFTVFWTEARTLWSSFKTSMGMGMVSVVVFLLMVPSLANEKSFAVHVHSFRYIEDTAR